MDSDWLLEGLDGDYRMVRSLQEDGSVKLVFEGAVQQYDPSLFVPCPVSKGESGSKVRFIMDGCSLVLMDGWVYTVQGRWG